ncbi:MAG: hypothetical protein HY040_19570 [Planctomycetes bacterium]|nr:hypothetical protein [Planctomycetota bacterium]
MHIRILDLDGSIPLQNALTHRYKPVLHNLRHWGPRLRIGCSFRRFHGFTRSVNKRLRDDDVHDSALTFCGSGDFHHASLALVSRIRQPFNLLVIDNHPDWMRGVPFMHCGTWLYHAARLPMVQQVFHVGGDVDFDNAFRWLAPWRLIQDGKINVFPSVRTFNRGKWRHVIHEPVRPNYWTRSPERRLENILQPFEEDLKRWPLYISLDKDAMVRQDAVVNWDSGHLELPEVLELLRVFCRKAKQRLVGMDVIGDWSPVQSQGLFRKLLGWTEHPALEVRPGQATERNEETNLALVETLMAAQATRETAGRRLRIAA